MTKACVFEASEYTKRPVISYNLTEASPFSTKRMLILSLAGLGKTSTIRVGPSTPSTGSGTLTPQVPQAALISPSNIHSKLWPCLMFPLVNTAFNQFIVLVLNQFHDMLAVQKGITQFIVTGLCRDHETIIITVLC